MNLKIGKKAFTLIELMIVVVILGVLMSTILPKLTGAQARARDAGRIADLGNIAAALQVFYDDNGYYPTETDSGDDTKGYCLSSGTGVSASLTQYMQSQKVPMDPQGSANKYLCGANTDNSNLNAGHGRYYYSTLTKNGLKRNSYVLCADMETLQKANTHAYDLAESTNQKAADNTAISIETAENNTYEDVLKVVGIKVGDDKFTKEPEVDGKANAGASVYCILRP